MFTRQAKRQGSSRNFENASINRVPQSAFLTNFTRRGYKARLLNSKLLKLELWLSLSGLVNVLATNISSFSQKCANEYLQHSALC